MYQFKSNRYVMDAFLLFVFGGHYCLAGAPVLTLPTEVTLLSGSPLHIPLDGRDTVGDPIAYRATSDNALVSTHLSEGNRSLQIAVADYGNMVFELFEDRVPRVTERIISLAEDGFYDGIIFHRVIDGFVIQGGDPTGTGSGGSRLGDFDDQFDVDLQHNSPGILSMAKTGDDTNDSQFFVTDLDSDTRHLDFNHSIFGHLVEGFDVLDSISMVPTANGSPITNVVMDSVEVFVDEENALLMLKAPEGSSGDANVTVTVTDPDGNVSVQTVHVIVKPDTFNGGPFLEYIADVHTTINRPVSLQLTAVDVEGDPVLFNAVLRGTVPFDFQIDSSSGLIDLTPPRDFLGELSLLVGVEPLNGSDTVGVVDSQMVTIQVAVPEPSSGVAMAVFVTSLVMFLARRRQIS
jgi:cyclophilin family peptidyl-prolyl cis-trans isomerase